MSSSISVAELTLPKGVEVIEKKSAITFIRGEKKAVLKGRALEITNPIKDLGKRLSVYPDEVRQKSHLGSIKAVIRNITDIVDLNMILKKYYK